MKRTVMALLLLATIAACSNDAAPPTAQTNAVAALPAQTSVALAAPAGCMTFRSTGYSSFVGGAWSGSMHTLIGDEVLVPVPGPMAGGELTDRAIERIIKGLPYRGTEWMQFNYTDGSIYGEDSYIGHPAAVEGQWEYHAQGKFTGGTGRYEGATGSFESRGPFLMYPALDDPNGGVALITTLGHICLQ